MKRHLCLVVLAVAIAGVFATFAAAQHAVEAVSYDPGTTPAIDFGSGLPYNLTTSALGEPSRFTADDFFPSVVSPFNPPFKRSQLLSVGETGHVTLRLSHYALPQPGGKEIGVFAHAGLIDIAFPTGQADSPAAAFSIDSAIVDMSENGSIWHSLGEIVFDIPTNGYSDVIEPFAATPGSVESDFQKPFAGSLSSFDGLTHAEILALFDGSGGGKWLDIPAGLARVGYIRFRVEDDGNPAVPTNFELDGVAINRAAMGAPTPEPGTATLMLLALLSATAMRRPAGHAAPAARVPAR